MLAKKRRANTCQLPNQTLSASTPSRRDFFGQNLMQRFLFCLFIGQLLQSSIRNPFRPHKQTRLEKRTFGRGLSTTAPAKTGRNKGTFNCGRWLTCNNGALHQTCSPDYVRLGLFYYEEDRYKRVVFSPLIVTEHLTKNSPGGGGTPRMKGVGMLVVSLRGVSFAFWSHLGCSAQNAIIFSREGLV